MATPTFAAVARSPRHVALGPTVFVGTVHARSCVSADVLRLLWTTYLENLDTRLRQQHSTKRWHVVAHETASDSFSMTVVFERAQVATRLDNVAAGFTRLLTLNVSRRGNNETLEIKRRTWNELKDAAFIYTDCTPAPEGTFSAAVTSAQAEAWRQAGAAARTGSVQELSSASPKLLPKPNMNTPAPGARTAAASATASRPLARAGPTASAGTAGAAPKATAAPPQRTAQSGGSSG